MAYAEKVENTMSCRANEALTGGLFVKVDPAGTDHKDVIHSGDGEKVLGMVQWPAADGEAITVVLRGKVNMTSGAAVTVGDHVASDAAGKVVTGATGDDVAGTALSTASGADETISVYLNPAGAQVPA